MRATSTNLRSTKYEEYSNHHLNYGTSLEPSLVQYHASPSSYGQPVDNATMMKHFPAHSSNFAPLQGAPPVYFETIHQHHHAPPQRFSAYQHQHPWSHGQNSYETSNNALLLHLSPVNSSHYQRRAHMSGSFGGFVNPYDQGPAESKYETPCQPTLRIIAGMVTTPKVLAMDISDSKLFKFMARSTAIHPVMTRAQHIPKTEA